MLHPWVLRTIKKPCGWKIGQQKYIPVADTSGLEGMWNPEAAGGKGCPASTTGFCHLTSRWVLLVTVGCIVFRCIQNNLSQYLSQVVLITYDSINFQLSPFSLFSLKHTISSWYLPSRGLPAAHIGWRPGKLSSSNQAANSELEVQLELERKRAQEAPVAGSVTDARKTRWGCKKRVKQGGFLNP